MGYKSIAAALHHSRASGTTKLVLIAISHFHDDIGENGAWPSQETLAELCNVSVRSVQRSIKELIELGEIEQLLHRGKGKTFDRQTNRYFLTIECPDTCESGVNHKDLGDEFDRPTRQIRPTYTTDLTDLHDAPVALTIMNNQEQSKTINSGPLLVAVNN